MRSFWRGSAAVLALGIGLYGAMIEGKEVGTLVTSNVECASVIGAACAGQDNDLKMICAGGVGSDCTGCGCQSEHPPNDKDQGYAKPDANCKDSPTCVFAFRRGSCNKE